MSQVGGLGSSALLDIVNEERTATCELLAGLAAPQLYTASLCRAWTVGDVACHLASWRTRHTRLWESLREAALIFRARTPEGVNQWYLDRWRRRGLSAVLDELARPIPPDTGGLLTLALVEHFVHAQDVRRPLGLPRRYSERCLTLVLNASTDDLTSRALAIHDRIKGLAWSATDVPWGPRGEGPEVLGPAEALIMAMHGRRAVLADLAGSGSAILGSRRAPRTSLT